MKTSTMLVPQTADTCIMHVSGMRTPTHSDQSMHC